MTEQADILFVPTRLIRVDREPHRLIETCYDPSRGDGAHRYQYAAMSYCWGSPEQAISQLKTEKSTLSSRLSSIEEREMTRVLRDAVKTCHSLSIPCLWIDALCIIQDVKQDWEQESSMLDRIFSNSYLTIVVVSSESCNKSFLSHETAKLEVPWIIRFQRCARR
ncbi:heterokaryon incompatibility protein-domain-containing protein [Jackrogersella minutella]|nr:heterokaryon incompatibility protein-domain-containing protein [Jackrogersella minutella]